MSIRTDKLQVENRMDRRITKHPVLTLSRKEKVTFRFRDREITGYKGESIAAALFASGVDVFSHSPQYGHPRGWFCGIGKCSSCLMTVNGVPNVRTCITPIQKGLHVEPQFGKAELLSTTPMDTVKEERDVNTLVVGAGPAGLSAAIVASKLGIDVIGVDENPRLGGQLIKQTHKFFGSREQHAGTRGIEIADQLLGQLHEVEGKYISNASVIGYFGKDKKHKFFAVKRGVKQYKLIQINAHHLVAATGAIENRLPFPGNYLPGVYGAGGVQTLMNVYGIKPGRKALIVGGGNVGLILAYQLLQAGVEVKALVEAMPHIGGYLVHASKITRHGIPFLPGHTILQAEGETCVQKATIAKLDENWQPVRGSEEELDVDLICIGVGLSPSCRLLFQAGCRKAFVKELGGWVPIHDQNLRTDQKGFYVAGDASGIEEASIAMAEGKIAAADIAQQVGKNIKQAKQVKDKAFEELKKLRDNPFGKTPQKGKKKVWELRRDYDRKSA